MFRKVDYESGFLGYITSSVRCQASYLLSLGLNIPFDKHIRIPVIYVILWEVFQTPFRLSA